MTDIGTFITDTSNTVRFSLKHMNRTLTGPEQALQLVAKVMFTEPGSSLWAPSDGGGMMSLLRKGIQSQANTRTDAAVALRKTMDTIKRIQDKNLPSNATVTNLELIDAESVPSTGKIRIRVRILLMSGNSFSTNFLIGAAQ